MTILQRIKRNVSFKFIGEITSRILSVIFYIYVIRKLGDNDFGVYSFVYSFCGILVILMDPGINTLLIRDISRNRQVTGEYIGNISTIKIILSVVVLFLVNILSVILKYSGEMLLYLNVMCIIMVCNSLMEYIGAIFSSWENMNYEAWLKIANKIIIAILGTATLLAGYRLKEFLFSMAVAYALTLLVGFYLVQKKIILIKILFDLKLCKHIIYNAFPMALTMIFIILYLRIDVVLLQFMKWPDAAIGWYSAGMKIIETVSAIPLLITGGIFPVISELYKKNPERLEDVYRRSMEIMAASSIPLTFGLYFFPDKLVQILYGSEFIRTSDILRILAWSTVFLFFNYSLMNFLIAVEKQKYVAISTGICVLVNIISNLALIPRLGYFGTSISVVILQIVLLLMNYYFVFKYFYEGKNLLKIKLMA
ncbi:MAG: flippase [Elusimicrobiota bacterium]